MGAVPSAAAERFAKGIPEQLDWRMLMNLVFQPSHQAVLLYTSEELMPGEMPRKQVLKLESHGADEALPLNGGLGTVGLVSQKGNKMQPNQDCGFYFHFLDGDGSKIWCACVLDGHGPLGHEMSSLAMQWLPLLILREPSLASEPGKLIPADPQTLFLALQASFRKIGDLMQKASDTGWGPRGYSGATCTLAFCARGLLHCANVGDSRMVLGTFAEDQVDCRVLTRDHKPEDPEERLRIEAHGGIVARQRVYLDEWPYVGLNMSRSLGDAKLHAVGVSDVPDVSTVFLAQCVGDAQRQFLVVASDGVWDFTSTKEVADLVGATLHGEDPQSAAELLVTRAQAGWQAESEELDDITAIIVSIGPESDVLRC